MTEATVFDIFAVPPHGKTEVFITHRDTQEKADAFAVNLGRFGYAEVRVAERKSDPEPQ